MNIMHLILYALNQLHDHADKEDTLLQPISINIYDSEATNRSLADIGPQFLTHIIYVSLDLLKAIFLHDNINAHMVAFLHPKINEIEEIMDAFYDLHVSLEEEKNISSATKVDHSTQIALLQEQVKQIRENIKSQLSKLQIDDASIAQKRDVIIQKLEIPFKGSVFDEANLLADTIPLIGSEILEDLKGTVRVFLRKYDPSKPVSIVGGTRPTTAPQLYEAALALRKGKDAIRKSEAIRTARQASEAEAARKAKEAQAIINAKKLLPAIPHVAATFENETNEQIYNTHFRPLFQTAIIGKNICVFGYGYSGSGKTFTLLGNSKRGGIITFMVDDFIASGYTIVLSNAKEYYGSPREVQYVEMVKINIISPGQIKGTKELLDFLNRVESERKARGRIKATPFNPESSRSHLILQFDVIKDGNPLGRITFMDLGGRENPIEIYDSLQTGISFPFFKTNMKTNREKLNLGTLSEEWKALLPAKNDQEKRDYIVDLVLEGFFINDSLNRLQNYLNGRQGKLVTKRASVGITADYLPDNIYNTKSNMTSVLELIDGDKKTKFVMMCCVKNDLQSLEYSNQTVKYANSISGANIKNYASYSGINLNDELQNLQGIIAQQSKFM